MSRRSAGRRVSFFLIIIFALNIMSANVFATEVSDTSRIMDNIAAGFVNNSNEWVIMDMAAYGILNPQSLHKTNEETLQSYINYAIGTVADYTKGQGSPHSTYAKAEIILRAIGGDTEKLYAVNSNTPMGINDKLKTVDMSQANMYDAPWLLLANLQGNFNLPLQDIEQLIAVIGDEQPENGVYGYTWDGVYYSDPDTTAGIIAALSTYYDTNPAAKEIVDKAIAGLSAEQGADGSFGSSNSDAVVIIALVSIGIDPAIDSRFIKNGISLYDALLAAVNGEMNGFTFFGETNELSTEQGFRALIAVEQMKNIGGAFNIYDFSNVAGQAIRATGAGVAMPPSDPTGEGDIAIIFSLKADGEYWIDNADLAIREGSSVYHAFIEALESRFNHKGAESGYVRSVTNLDTGIMFSEFDHGIDSGWLYKVNGEIPEKGFLDYILNDGDEVIWFFTDDYIRDTGRLSTDEPAETFAFSDVADTHFAYAAIMKARERSIVSGMGGNAFQPDRGIRGAEFVAMLYNAEGGGYISSRGNFSGVTESDWYYTQVIWALEKEIIEVGEFEPSDYLLCGDVFSILQKYLPLEENVVIQKFAEGFNSEEEITRAEAVSIIIHMMDIS